MVEQWSLSTWKVAILCAHYHSQGECWKIALTVLSKYKNSHSPLLLSVCVNDVSKYLYKK